MAWTGAWSGGWPAGWAGGTTSGPTEPPAAPTGVQAAAGNALVVLTWDAVPAATSYHVYRSLVPTSGGYTLVASPTAPSFVDTGRTNDTTYYYQVAAVNSEGEGDRSAAVSATPSTIRAPGGPPVRKGF